MFVRKLLSPFRLFGPMDGVLYLLGRILALPPMRMHLIRYHIVLQPVAAKPFLPARWGRDIDVRAIAEGDPAFADLPLSADVLEFRFGQGAKCFGAFVDNRIAGTIWLSFGRYQEDEVHCVFDLGEGRDLVWDFDVYVKPEHRGGLVFARLWDYANASLREGGAKNSMSRISAFNPASINAHRALDAARVGTLTAIGRGGWQLIWSSLRPYLRVARRGLPPPVFSAADAATGSS